MHIHMHILDPRTRGMRPKDSKQPSLIDRNNGSRDKSHTQRAYPFVVGRYRVLLYVFGFISICCAGTPSINHGELPRDTIIRQGVHPHLGPRTKAEKIDAEVWRNLLKRKKEEEDKADTKQNGDQDQIEEKKNAEKDRG